MPPRWAYNSHLGGIKEMGDYDLLLNYPNRGYFG
jgi:hypothetical protein